MTAVSIIMQLVTAVPASAASISLCAGFAQCRERSLSDAGYAPHRPDANWGMDPGTNCTNYVGYRLSSAGRRTARLPHLTYASTFGPAARRRGLPVRSTPTVGSVAWWAANAAPAGERGHVAYVERVHADGSFDVSEDSFNGDFGWRRVLPREQGWPSGFIVFPRSDGTPLGELTSLRSPRRDTLDLWGWGSDPDAFGRPMTILMTVGGTRTNPRATRLSTSTTFFRYHRILRSTRMPSGRRTVHVYLKNRAGTPGQPYRWLGSRAIRIR